MTKTGDLTLQQKTVHLCPILKTIAVEPVSCHIHVSVVSSPDRLNYI